MNERRAVVSALLAEGMGILAADESTATAGKRLFRIGLENTKENRRHFRELMCTSPKLDQVISGVIFYDETLRDETSDGLPFPALLVARGIVPGVKVDRGLIDGYGGKVTQGLDDLTKRVEEYYTLGARFTKWRAVFSVSPDLSDSHIEMNAVIMARYAQIAEASGLVPIVEPEIIYDGDHTIEDAARVSMRVLQCVTNALIRHGVTLETTIIKTSMVLAGKQSERESSPEEVADTTLRVLHLSVPHTIGGVVFLSGGQTPKQATRNLNAIGVLGSQPWKISSSFSRALEEPFLDEWGGKEENKLRAQEALCFRAIMNGNAMHGMYNKTEDV